MVEQPEQVVPGDPLYFATALSMAGYAQGVLVESHTGRPTKVEGNPKHPASLGATDAIAQASILSLYDPDRSREVRRNNTSSTWQDFVRFAQDTTATNVVVLAEESSSPTLAAMRQQLQQRFPQLRWITYRDEGDDPGGASGIPALLSRLTGRGASCHRTSRRPAGPLARQRSQPVESGRVALLVHGHRAVR